MVCHLIEIIVCLSQIWRSLAVAVEEYLETMNRSFSKLYRYNHVIWQNVSGNQITDIANLSTPFFPGRIMSY